MIMIRIRKRIFFLILYIITGYCMYSTSMSITVDCKKINSNTFLYVHFLSICMHLSVVIYCILGQVRGEKSETVIEPTKKIKLMF